VGFNITQQTKPYIAESPFKAYISSLMTWAAKESREQVDARRRKSRL